MTSSSPEGDHGSIGKPSEGQQSDNFTTGIASEDAVPSRPADDVSASAASVAETSGDDGEQSPLMKAVAAGDVDAVEALLKAGHDAAEQNDDTGAPLVKADFRQQRSRATYETSSFRSTLLI